MGEAMDAAPARPLAAGARSLAEGLRRAAPGLLVSLVIAVAATFLSEHYGGPVMLFALLLGMAFHFLSQEGRCVEGIGVASRTVLRVGVALLGARITVEQILALGPVPVAIIVTGVAATIAVGALAGRALGLGTRFGVLTGGATAICGASAALAIASVLPKGPTAERDTVFTVVGVTTLSTVAMILYPLVVAAFGLDHVEAGVFLGGTIHDVAQVVGAGYSVSEETGNVATFTKLFRVALLLPVVLGLSMALSARGQARGGRGALLPWFLIAFAALVGVNSTGLMPTWAITALVEASRWCLVTAIAALGMKTSLKTMAAVGTRPIALIVVETLFLAALVLAALLAAG
jgi:uncharacterized integral membrane protein (TIGR00698 family)